MSGPIYAGVMVLASAAMARNLAGTIPISIFHQDLVTAVERRPRNAGVEAACQQVLAIRDSGAFDGVHLIPVSRYRQVAALLEAELRPPRNLGGPDSCSSSRGPALLFPCLVETDPSTHRALSSSARRFTGR